VPRARNSFRTRSSGAVVSSGARGAAFEMATNLRLALLLDPLTARSRGGEHAAELARALSARGHEVCLYGAPFQARPRAEEESSRAGPEGAANGRGAHGREGPERRSHDRSPDGGRKHLLGYRPDAVLAYDALSPTAWLAARIGRRLRIPLVLVEHGDRADGSWLVRSLSRMGEGLWGPYVRSSASALIALDPVARAQAVRAGFRESRIQVVPHGVDVERFRPGLSSPLVARHRIRGRILLCAAPLEARSGLELVLAAFARTVGQREDWSLVIAGDGTARSRLRAMAERLGIAARVHLLPAPQESELPSLLSSATLLVLSGLEDEPRGAQLAQRIACGLPLLASDLPRTKFLVEPSGCGLLAPPGDLGAWTAILQRAASAPEARKRWSEAARRFAEDHLAWNSVAKAFEASIDARS
jgi:glycosyltransferase involved in cell wall biosynthesis